MTLKNKGNLGIKRIDPLGVEIPMYDITTGTGDFIANGVVSHNCFARPTHEYLDLTSGEDFERKIVVKVNAVERLRAELHPRGGRGEHIAMGTNTDPYQRCEGKYHLTRGIVEELSERGEPVLDPHEVDARPARPRRARRSGAAGRRARQLLDRHARRRGVAHHRAGHAAPAQRVEAVRSSTRPASPAACSSRRSSRACPTGPSSSRRWCEACVDAGATTISPIFLHLRPGVREQYMAWLERERPDLLPTYEKLYPRSYAAKSEQQKVTKLVYGFVRRFGGFAVQPGSTRDTGHEKAKATTTKRRTKPPAQLDLGM